LFHRVPSEGPRGKIMINRSPLFAVRNFLFFRAALPLIRACTHKSRTLTDLAMSALPQKADIRASFRHVCLGHKADMREQICANRKTAQQRFSENSITL